MKVRFDCPLDFLSETDISVFLEKNGLQIDNLNPDIIVVNPGTSRFLDKAYFSEFHNLKFVCTPSTGVNHIDTKYLDSLSVKYYCLLDNRPALDDIHASAEFTWIHIMNLHRKFLDAVHSIDSWRSSENESLLRSNELHRKTIGIIGMGRIGNKIANYASSFGMNIKFYDPYVDVCTSIKRSEKVKSLDELCVCDVISINCYLTNETREMITYGSLDNLRKGSIVVNTSRGEVVDENYIVHLVTNRDVLYGADVLQGEQNLDKLFSSPLYRLSKSMPNRVTLTPHVAGATKESQTKALQTVIDVIRGQI